MPRQRNSTGTRSTNDTLDAPADVVEAVLLASRVLVAVAANSIAEVADAVTLPQYRTLVVLAAHGAMTPGALAEQLAIHPSTVTRQCDRLVSAELIQRGEAYPDRRSMSIRLTARGQQVVEQVTERRRAAIAGIVAKMPDDQRAGLVSALRTFSAAAGEIPPEQSWSLGWGPVPSPGELTRND
jgi:DNA-binding MarR family transcriptional regulator